MIRELGVVDSIDGQHIHVKTQVKTGCSSCDHQNHCGTGLLSKALPNRNGLVRVNSKESVSVGDTVELLIPERDMMRFSFLMYGLPLLGLVLGTTLGYVLAPSSEIISICLGVLGSAATFRALRYYFQRQDIQIQKTLSIKASYSDAL